MKKEPFSEITSSSLNQLALYATLEVGEVWQDDGAELIFYQLQSAKYVAIERSPTFPMLAPARVLDFLTECQTEGVNQAVKSLRKWVRENSQHD